MNALFERELRMTFIGAGNMAEALVRGIIRAKLLPSRCVQVTDPDKRRRDYFQANFGVTVFERNTDGIRGAQAVILAVKPQVIGDVLKDVGTTLNATTLVISIAAGITTQRLQTQLPGGMRVVRVMPNMPALAGVGVSVYCPGLLASKDDTRLVEALFQSVGVVMRLDEKHLDAVTALSGSGPAYVFFLAECMLQAGVEMGLDRATAKELTLGTMRGATRLLEIMGPAPEELRCRVTSKGGTTAAALEVLEEGRVRETFVRAIQAAQKRSKELSK